MFEKGQIVISKKGAIIGQVTSIIPNQYGKERITIQYIDNGQIKKQTLNSYNLKTLDQFQNEFDAVKST